MARSLNSINGWINEKPSKALVNEKIIRVLIVHRSQLLASALTAIFDSEPMIEVVGQARCCADCCGCAAKLVPDVVICDLTTEDLTGAWSLDLFRKCLPNIPTIVLSDNDQQRKITKAAKLGAQGFLTKNVLPVKLVEAVQTVGGGGYYIEANVRSKMLSLLDCRAGKRNSQSSHLNKRERQILRLMARGMTNEQIGSEIYLSTSAVKYHNSAIFRKLGVSNRVEAIKVAGEQALLD